MSTRPDMLVQFAHHLAEQFHQRGYSNVQVRAEVMMSLNERRPQLMFDPTIDLAAQPRTLGHYSWLMPLDEPLFWGNNAAARHGG